MASDAILVDLAERGLLDTCTDLESLAQRLRGGAICGYCGFDPSADSLHVGSLLSLAVLRLWIVHGHDVVALVGGFTGMIGDPSGKSQERNLLDAETLNRNRAALNDQIRRLLTIDGKTPTIVDNRDWFEQMSALEFLRDLGKLMPVKDMLERESVKNRLAAGGLSLTEFVYQALQAHDFAHLRESIKCELQLGGTDQYGNITAGTDMIRRRGLGSAWGLVWPLLMKADGSKFGKTESGAVWLSPDRTTSFAFHQYWLNVADADVRSLLAKFTLMSKHEIDTLMSRHDNDRGARLAQRVLADEVTAWVHGGDAATAANRIAATLFGGQVGPDDVDEVANAIPSLQIRRTSLEGMQVAQLATRAGLCSTVSEARRVIAHGGLYVGAERITDPTAAAPAAADHLLLRRGTRSHALVVVCGS